MTAKNEKRAALRMILEAFSDPRINEPVRPFTVKVIARIGLALLNELEDVHERLQPNDCQR